MFLRTGPSRFLGSPVMPETAVPVTVPGTSLKECFRPCLNWRPSTCYADVITTTTRKQPGSVKQSHLSAYPFGVSPWGTEVKLTPPLGAWTMHHGESTGS